MQIASWLLATTTLIAPAPQNPDLTAALAMLPAASDPTAADQQLPVSPITRTAQPLPAPHRLGVGGTFTMSNRGAGAGIRYWFGEHLGTAVQATWFRGSFRGPGGTSANGNFMQAFASATYLFGVADAGKVANLRPYVGAGALYVNGVRTPGLPGNASGTGPVAFGGVELTLQDYPGLSISNEIIYTGLPSGFVRNRVAYQLSIHMYLR